jgi:hypothetical protein
MGKLKEMLKKIGVFAIMLGVVFSFLTICNWGYNPMDWNGFSRVCLGLFIVVPIIIGLDDL